MIKEGQDIVFRICRFDGDEKYSERIRAARAWRDEFAENGISSSIKHSRSGVVEVWADTVEGPIHIRIGSGEPALSQIGLS